MKDRLSDFLGEVVDTTTEMFVGGGKDAINFLTYNGQEGLRAMGGEMGDMMAMMGAQLVIQYVNKGYERYQSMKVLGITRLQTAPKEAEEEFKDALDEEMKDEEVKEEESQDTKKEKLLAKWGKAIQKDKETRIIPQRPLSKTYKQTCPFTVEKKRGQALMNDD